MINSDKERLLDRAEEVIAIIDNEIKKLQQQIEKDKLTVDRMEKRFRDSEEDFYIAAESEGWTEKEIRDELDNIVASHDSDEYLISTKQLINGEELHLANLKLDREIYLYYLNNNEETE